jgi:hypothetical protein
MSNTDLSREGLLKIVREVWEDRDPVPEGLVERMQSVVQAEAILAEVDLDYELLLLVERSTELAGARGTAAYTLRFAHSDDSGDTEVLLRAVANDAGGARLDGWLAPPSPMRVRATEVTDHGEGRSYDVETDTRGRFEFADLPRGLYRLWLTPVDAEGAAFGTPAFEI